MNAYHDALTNQGLPLDDCPLPNYKGLYTTFVLDLKIASLRYIVQLEELHVGQREKAAAAGVTLFSFEDVELCGADYPQPQVPQAEVPTDTSAEDELERRIMSALAKERNS